MFDLDEFLSKMNVRIKAVTFQITDERTGVKSMRTFYFPELERRSLEGISKYGFSVTEIGYTTEASGNLNLAELFGKFAEEGGLK